MKTTLLPPVLAGLLSSTATSLCGAEPPSAGSAQGAPEGALTYEQMFEVGKVPAVDLYMSSKTDKSNVLSRIVGAGFIVHESGYVVTCSHVAGCGGIKTVGFHDTTSLDGELPFENIGWNDAMDVAIVKIIAPDKLFAPARLGDSRKIRVGDRVIVIGNPDGQRHSVVRGRITSTAANWGYQWADAGTWHHDFICCDAPAVEGYSGGPMFNDRGEVIGLFSGSMSGGETPSSFAIPMHRILSGLPDVLDLEKIRGFVLGMRVDGFGDGTVGSVDEKGPAAAAGVRKGDRVTSVNGRPVKVGFDFYYALKGSSAGDEVALGLRRGEETIAASVRLLSHPLRPDVPVAEVISKRGGEPRHGIRRSFYNGPWNSVSDFATRKPDEEAVVEAIGVDPYEGRDNFGLVFSGYVEAPADGTYTFYVGSDDGSRLYIGDQLVVDNDGLHGPAAAGGNIGLKAGFHPITVSYFERSGGEMLEVLWKGPGVGKQHLPASALYY